MDSTMADPRWTVWLPSQSRGGFDVAVAIAACLAALTIVPSSPGRFAGRLLRWPTILVLYLAIALELILYVLVRVAIAIVENVTSHADRRAARLRHAMVESESYGEWYKNATDLDTLQGRDAWKSDLDDYTATHFSWSLLEALVSDLRTARGGDGDVRMALAVLQQCIRKNVGGSVSEELYCTTNAGEPKAIVGGFVAEVVETLRWVTDRAEEGGEGSAMHGEVREFLKGLRSTFGPTALCLSGGGMMALYHLGHVRALLEEGILPHVISGSSAGSLIASLVCTRTDQELKRDLKPDVLKPHFVCCARSWPQRIASLLRTGAMFDNDEWLELLEWFTCGNLTFAEAHRKTGRTLCIALSTVTVKAPPIVLHHMTAPNVLISSAVVASSAVPGILLPAHLHQKQTDGSIRILPEQYFDGSIKQDIPLLGLAEMLNCQFFVAAQCNPHLVPFVFNAYGEVGNPTQWKNSRRGGHLLSGLELFVKMSMRFKLQFLHYSGADTGFTSQLMIQDLSGTTNIVPRVSPFDYLKIVEDPTMDDLRRYFQRGSVAAYKNCAHIKLHYRVQEAMHESLSRLDEKGTTASEKTMLQQIFEEEEKKKSSASFTLEPKGRKRYSVLSSIVTSHQTHADSDGSVVPTKSRQVDDLSIRPKERRASSLTDTIAGVFQIQNLRAYLEG